MVALAILIAALTAAPDASRPSETPAPPLKVIARYNLPPFGPDEYDQSYEAKLQNARLAKIENATGVALAETEAHRVAQYPAKLSLGQRKRLYRLEVKWLEAEKLRRDRVATWRQLDALAK